MARGYLRPCWIFALEFSVGYACGAGKPRAYGPCTTDPSIIVASDGTGMHGATGGLVFQEPWVGSPRSSCVSL